MKRTGEFRPGVMFGNWQIVKFLGGGGMGDVYLARHLILRKAAALKVARHDHRDPELTRKYFLREARLAAGVKHRNVVRIFDAGETDGRLYLVMALIDGQDLSEVLKASQGSLQWRTVLTWIRDAALGLEAVHKRGLIHRDIKPQNLMLAKSGRVMVTDFGLVREDDPNADMTCGPLGTPAYMSPEQCNEPRLDQLTDLYSLGATAYTLLCGTPPFPGNRHEVMAKLTSYTEARRLDQFQRGIPGDVAEVVSRAMAPLRKNRFSNVQTFTEEINRLLARQNAGDDVDERTAESIIVQLPPEGSLRSDNHLNLPMIWCPPGNLLMGSSDLDPDARDNELPQVSVTLSRGFWLGETPVTQGQFYMLMESKPWKRKGYVKDGVDRAASYTSWDEAIRFCEKLTEVERLAGRLGDGEEYRLPTEAEWEYACRAGTSTAYGFGDDASELADHALFEDNVDHRVDECAQPVKQKKPNRWGLYDMHGNVWEWCRDCYVELLPGGTDPAPKFETLYRVLRGGSWSCRSANCRSAYRSWMAKNTHYENLGFRVARCQVVADPSQNQ